MRRCLFDDCDRSLGEGTHIAGRARSWQPRRVAVVRTRLIPEIMLDMTDCADRPTMMPDTPPTVSSGAMLMPTTWSVIRPPAATSSQLARPLTGSTTRCRAYTLAWARSLAPACRVGSGEA